MWTCWPMAWVQGSKQDRHSSTGPVFLPQWLGCCEVNSGKNMRTCGTTHARLGGHIAVTGGASGGLKAPRYHLPKFGGIDIAHAMGWWLSSSAWKLCHRERAPVEMENISRNRTEMRDVTYAPLCPGGQLEQVADYQRVICRVGCGHWRTCCVVTYQRY